MPAQGQLHALHPAATSTGLAPVADMMAMLCAGWLVLRPTSAPGTKRKGKASVLSGSDAISMRKIGRCRTVPMEGHLRRANLANQLRAKAHVFVEPGVAARIADNAALAKSVIAVRVRMTVYPEPRALNDVIEIRSERC